MDDKKAALFERYTIPKAVATLAIPSVISCLVMVLYNMADTYFVGMLQDPVQTAGVSLGATVILSFNAITNLFGTGASSSMSRSLGRKDYEGARRCASFCFWLALLCAVLIAAGYSLFRAPVLSLLGADETTAQATADYLFWTCTCGAVPAIMNVVLSNMVRSEGEVLHASIGVMSGCLLNIVLDPFLILPQFAGMGAAGAGAATFISNCVACLYMLVIVYLHRKNTIVCLSPLRFGFNKQLTLDVFGVGVPASIQNLLNVTGTLVLNNFAAAFGAAAVSAIGIAHKVNMMPMYLAMGITQGVMPFISYNYASGARKRMKDCILFVLKLSVVITIVLAAALFVFSADVVRLFLDNEEVVMHGEKLLRAMSLGVPFLSVDFLGVAVYQAIGKGRYSLAFAIARKIVLEIPALILFNKLMPLYGMGYAQPFAELVLTIAAVFMLRKIFREAPEQKQPTAAEP